MFKSFSRPFSWCFKEAEQSAQATQIPSSSSVSSPGQSTLSSISSKTERTRPVPRVQSYGEFDVTPKPPVRENEQGKFPARKNGYGGFGTGPVTYRPGFTPSMFGGPSYLPTRQNGNGESNRRHPPRNARLEAQLQDSMSRRNRPQSTDRNNRVPQDPIATSPLRHQSAPPPAAPSASRPRSRPPPGVVSNAAMGDALLGEVLTTLARTLNHIQYAVCGRAAMNAYGNQSHLPRHISLCAPEHSKDALLAWAASNSSNFEPITDQGDCVGFRTADGQLRRIRVKFLSGDEFNRLRISHPPVKDPKGGTVPVPVMALPSLLDSIALGYSSDTRAISAAVRDAISQDILYVLSQIIKAVVQDGRHEDALTPYLCTNVLNPLFWDVFTVMHPGSPELFAMAGLTRQNANSYSSGMEQVRPESRRMNAVREEGVDHRPKEVTGRSSMPAPSQPQRSTRESRGSTRSSGR